MSQENMEIVQAHFDARNRRDLMTLLALWRSEGEPTGRRPEDRIEVVARGPARTGSGSG